MKNHQHQKVGLVGTQKWSSIGSGDQLPSRNLELRSELNLLSNDGSQSWIRISSGLNNFVRYLTDKIRIHEDNEDTLASMVRLHNSRLENCGKLSNKCRQTCSEGEAKAGIISYLIIFSNWYSKSFKNMGWMLNQESNVIRATRMQRG